MTLICIGNLSIIGSDNGLSPDRRQAITWTNAGILLIEPLETNFSEILIKIHTFSFKKMHLKTLSVKWRPFCFSLIVLMESHCVSVFVRRSWWPSCWEWCDNNASTSLMYIGKKLVLPSKLFLSRYGNGMRIISYLWLSMASGSEQSCSSGIFIDNFLCHLYTWDSFPNRD